MPPGLMVMVALMSSGSNLQNILFKAVLGEGQHQLEVGGLICVLHANLVLDCF